MATSVRLTSNFNLATQKQRASSGRRRSQQGKVSCSSYHAAAPSYTRGSLGDQYRTLQVQFGASMADVKKAFRQLALQLNQYHPDVCKGSNCKVQFQNINEAYDVVMSNLRDEEEDAMEQEGGEMHGGDYDMWEGDEWMMGWEGAGVRDYANPYVHTT